MIAEGLLASWAETTIRAVITDFVGGVTTAGGDRVACMHGPIAGRG
jgi:hypothetical protein